jgi:hypothetical protein
MVEGRRKTSKQAVEAVTFWDTIEGMIGREGGNLRT